MSRFGLEPASAAAMALIGPHGGDIALDYIANGAG